MMKHVTRGGLLLFILLYGFLSFAVDSAQWSGKVIEVLEGDTITILHENREERIAVANIDCPNFDQPFGSIAIKFTSYLSLGQTVTVQEVAVDSNGHKSAYIILPDGHNLSRDLVEAGLAWVSKSISDQNSLSGIEAVARFNKLGIWSQQNPIPPWEWRKTSHKADGTSQVTTTASYDETSPLSKDEIDASASQNLKYESDEVDRFVIYRGFVVHFNCPKKGPNFTIHKLTLAQISSTKGEKARRRSSFFTDDRDLKSCSATNNDYKKSGYDRGHMVPAGDFYWNQLLKDETFVLTNISPQNPRLNRGIWASLENAIRDKVLKTGHAFYIITGAIYSDANNDVIGVEKVGIPVSFYKIIFDSDSNKMYGFLINNDLDKYDALDQYQVSVDFIETLVHEDFFDKLPDETETSLEAAISHFN